MEPQSKTRNQSCPKCNTDMKYIERKYIWDQTPEYKCTYCNSAWDIDINETLYKYEIPF